MPSNYTNSANKMLNAKNLIYRVKFLLRKRNSFWGRISLGIVLVPFAVCVLFLRALGTVFHLTYEEIAVYFNLYFQGVLLTLSAFLPFIGQCICLENSFFGYFCLILLFCYALLYVALFYLLIKRYPPFVYSSFNRCVKDLQQFSAYLKISYWAINLLIFVFAWLTLLAINLLLVCNILR